MSSKESVKSLAGVLKQYDKLAVAVSGGAASACLLREAVAALGPANVLALTVDNGLLPRRALALARRIAVLCGVEHHVLAVDAMALKGVRENGRERCRACGRAIFSSVAQEAWTYGISTVVSGACEEGCAAAAEELGVIHPFLLAGLGRGDVAARCGGALCPSAQSCACLAARIPLGTPLTHGILEKIEAAEDALCRMGLEHVRVMLQGQRPRLEIPQSQLEACAKRADEIAAALAAAGFPAPQGPENG